MKHRSYTAKLTEIQNCFEKLTFGNIKWQKIRHRRNYIKKAYEYSQEHNGKILKESIGSKLKRIFSGEPPLFKYDYYLPFEKIGKTELDIMKSYRQRYHPFVAVEKAEDRRLLALKRIGSVHSIEKPGTRMDFLVDDDVFPVNYEDNDINNENTNTNNNNKITNLITQKSYTVMDNSLTSPPYNSFRRAETAHSVFRNVLLSPPGCIIIPNEIEFKSPITSPHSRLNGSSPLCPKKSPIISLRKNPLCSDDELCLTINPPPQIQQQQQQQQQLLPNQLSHGVLPNKRNISESPPPSSSTISYKDRSYSAAAAYQYFPVGADVVINTNSTSPIRVPLSPPRSPTNSDSFNHYRISDSNVDELEVSFGSNSNLSDILHTTSSNLRISGKSDEEHHHQQQQQKSPPPQLVQLIQISPIKPRCLSYSNGEQVASVCSTMRGRKITLSKYVLEEDENKQDLNYRSTVYENEYEDELEKSDDIDYDKYINSDKPKYKLTKNKDK